MKHILKALFSLFVISFLLNNTVCFGASLKESLDTLIKQDPLSNKTLVAVSIRDAKTGNLVYQRYGNYLLHTASTLKAFTTPVALKYLGAENNISTTLYKSKNTDDIYFKLSGDPVLTYQDLVKLLGSSSIKSIKGNIIIDDSAIDSLPWGVGWMWDDENNSLMPKYNAYTIDHNIVEVTVQPTSPQNMPKVSISSNYKVKVVNTAITSSNRSIPKADELKVERKPWINPETIYVSGKVHSKTTLTIPVGSPKNHFISQLIRALKENNIFFDGSIITGKVPTDLILVSDINHKVKDVVSYTNQKSDNLGAEILLKLTGYKDTGKTGSTLSGLESMKKFYAALGVPITSQEIVDGSGASHNDLLQPNWMTSALVTLYKSAMIDVYLQTLAKPGQRGTLKFRLNNLANKLYAKTGTNAGISGLTGYLNARSGKTYAFSILIQNYRGSSIKAKSLENKIIHIINNY